MNQRRPWVVLVPGEAEWVERLTRELLQDREDGSEHHFMVIPGRGHYHAIVEKDGQGIIPDMRLGKLLSLDCEEPIYVLEYFHEIPHISRFVKGEDFRENQDPESLARSLGCVLPWTKEPPQRSAKNTARTVMLIQGLRREEQLDALEEALELSQLAGDLRLEETSHGLLLTDEREVLAFAHTYLVERFPLVALYAVTASPSLDFFVVNVTRKGKTEQFVPPPMEASLFPAIHEVMGERTPERILAALGIPKEWFQL